ncbi:MAG TPA: hypothetical protein VMN35_02165 [Gaiellaceae bacterium]|nr:hypothetical protein [Gaiellaceae bacterium]
MVGRGLLVMLVAAGLVASGCGSEPGDDGAPAEAGPPPAPASAPSPPPPPEPSPPVTPVPPPTQPMSWAAAGAFVWHETDVAPEALGEELRANGFGWVALFLHDGLSEDAVEDDWIGRFRRASGLPIGGWGVLRANPIEEAALARELLTRHGLDFYIANAEAEYGYTGPEGPDAERFGRSGRFVEAFRSRLPSLPAALSSYCRPDRHDLDWGAWRRAGFALLPQAYVNDFGQEAAPAMCVHGARAFFRPNEIHPTVGMHPGARRPLAASRYAQLLARAGTVGFSVYLAETRMTGEWQSFGAAIRGLGIARVA